MMILPTYVYTLFGIFALILWSTSVYCFKKTIDAFGIFSGLGMIRLTSGITGMVIFLLLNGAHKKFPYNKFTKITKESAIIVTLFIVNSVSNGLSYALPPTGQVLLQCSIIGYTWTLLLNILLVFSLDYKIKCKLGFYFGLVLGLFGIIISCVGFDFSKINFPKYFLQYYYCYIMATIAAFSWAYYSVYLTKFKKFVNDDHVFFALMVTGSFLMIFSIINPKLNKYNTMNPTFSNIGFLLYSVIFASTIPYCLWHMGYTMGDSKIIANFSLLSPITNIVTTQLVYEIPLEINTVVGAIILVIAMLFCKYSIDAPVNTPVNALVDPQVGILENVNVIEMKSMNEINEDKNIYFDI